MKSLLRFTLALVAMLSLFAFTERAQAQVTPVRYGALLTNGVVTIGNTVSSNLPAGLATVINLVQNKGLALWPHYAGAQSTNTGLISFQLALSYDGGSNYTTKLPIQATSTGTGAANVRDYAYFAPTTLNAATQAKLVTITNDVVQKITTTITNVYWSIP